MFAVNLKNKCVNAPYFNQINQNRIQCCFFLITEKSKEFPAQCTLYFTRGDGKASQKQVIYIKVTKVNDTEIEFK